MFYIFEECFFLTKGAVLWTTASGIYFIHLIIKLKEVVTFELTKIKENCFIE